MEDLGRIRFVTENYERLQGLRRLPLALCVTAVGLLVYLETGPLYAAVAVVMVYPAVFAEWTAGRLYERRFGRVRSRVRPTDYVFWAVLIGLAFSMNSTGRLEQPATIALGGIVGGAYVLAARQVAPDHRALARRRGARGRHGAALRLRRRGSGSVRNRSRYLCLRRARARSLAVGSHLQKSTEGGC